jgi:hypothetical protein
VSSSVVGGLSHLFLCPPFLFLRVVCPPPPGHSGPSTVHKCALSQAHFCPQRPGWGSHQNASCIRNCFWAAAWLPPSCWQQPKHKPWAQNIHLTNEVASSRLNGWARYICLWIPAPHLCFILCGLAEGFPLWAFLISEWNRSTCILRVCYDPADNYLLTPHTKFPQWLPLSTMCYFIDMKGDIHQHSVVTVPKSVYESPKESSWLTNGHKRKKERNNTTTQLKVHQPFWKTISAMGAHQSISSVWLWSLSLAL